MIITINIPKRTHITNGDVIKALFPNNKYVESEKFVIIQGETENISLWNNWWNAPYKADIEPQY